jgi:PAS domain S-box-containing protein
MTATETIAAEEVYRQALAALSEGIVVQDEDGAITSCNPAAERILGLTAEQMQGRTSVDPRWRAVHEDGSLFPGEEHPAMVTLRSGLPLEGVIMGVHKPDGSLSWISINSVPFRAGSDGASEDAVVTTFIDITARRSAEARLRESEERFQAAVRTMQDAFAIISPVRDEQGGVVDFRWEYANDASCSRNGLRREQMLGHRISEVLPGYTSTNVFKLHRRVAQTGEPARVDEVVWKGEWPTGWQVDRNYDGSVVRLGPNIIITGRDVTEARRNERELRLQAELLELAHDAVIVRDPAEGRVTFWNREAEAIYGYSRAEALDRVLQELLATVFPESRQAIDDALEREGQWRGELIHTRKDGTVIVVSSRQALQCDSDGSPIAIIELNSDITDREQAERQRAQVLAELEEAQHIAQLGSWRWDPSTGMRVWSAGMYVVYGRDPAAGPMDTDESFAFVHADDLERVRAAYARMREGGGGFELDYRLLTADGITRAVHAIARPDLDQPGCYRGTLQDVTERERAEQELGLRAELLDLAHDAVIVREPPESRVTFWNREAQAIYGYSPAEARDCVLQELLATVFPESRQAVDQALAREGQWAGELRHTGKDGTPIVVSSRQALQRAADGRPLAIIELNSDVTERKRGEEALRASEQRFRGGFENSPIGMALVELDGRYLEVNATLARMLGFEDPAELAGQSYTNFIHPDEVGLAHGAPQRVIETGAGRGTSVDLSAVAWEISEELRERDPAREVEFAIGDGLETMGDRRLVRVLMRNLLENAWRFTGARELARIEVLRAGAGVFAVRDNGVGFNMDFAGLLFEPFARLHREDEFPALGVGLTTVERIVRRHGGAVWGEGRVGEGATFSFTLEPPTETAT